MINLSRKLPLARREPRVRAAAPAVSFTNIAPPWLREAVKRWARQRLATGRAFNTIGAGTQALTRFSGFLDRCQPHGHPSDINRGLLERYLGWPAAAAPGRRPQGPVPGVFPRSFLEDTSATCLPRQAHS